MILNKTEPPRDKTNKMPVRPAKTQISLGIRPVWSDSLLSAWKKLGALATYWAHSKESKQTWRMPRLIWAFAGRTVVLLVLSWGGSNTSSELKPLDDAMLTYSQFDMSHLVTKPTKWLCAQADLSLRWAHMPRCLFCHEVAHMVCKHIWLTPSRRSKGEQLYCLEVLFVRVEA